MIHQRIAVLVLLVGCGSVTTATSKSGEPTVTAVMPDHGPTPGGAMITLTGTHFQSKDTPIVLVGGHEATNVMVSSDSSLTFTLPAGDEGAVVDVTVSNEHGFGTLPTAFTYNPLPIVLDVSPKFGKAAGGTQITITGRGFQDFEAGMPTITIAGGTATNVQVVDDHTIMATTGAATAGTLPFTPLDLTVANANGTTLLPKSFQLTSQGLLVTERCCSNRLFHIDLATKTVSIIGTAPRTLHGCATNQAGMTYAIMQDPSTGQRNLVTWNPLTGDVAFVGPLNDSASLNHGLSALVFVGANLYGFDSQNGGTSPTFRLVQVNPASGAVTVLGAAAQAVNRHNGLAVKDAASVWVADVANQSLDSLRLSDSTLTTGLPLSGGSAQIVEGLTVAGGKLYMIERNSPNIYTVDQSSGTAAVLTKFANIPNTSVTGMCETPPTF